MVVVITYLALDVAGVAVADGGSDIAATALSKTPWTKQNHDVPNRISESKAPR